MYKVPKKKSHGSQTRKHQHEEDVENVGEAYELMVWG